MNRIARSSIFVGLLIVAPALGVARAQETGKSGEARQVSSVLGPVDYSFVAQANLGAPFEIDSGRLAEEKARTPAIREYAQLMVSTHGPVKDALDAILRQKGIQAPPEPLLQGAYDTMTASLEAEHEDVSAFERQYLKGQTEYQKGNAALYRDEIQNGTDADLKKFAQQTLPKIEDHLERATKIAEDVHRRMLTH